MLMMNFTISIMPDMACHPLLHPQIKCMMPLLIPLDVGAQVRKRPGADTKGVEVDLTPLVVLDE